MSCDQDFERCLQNKFDMAFRSKNRMKPYHAVSSEPHRLIGTEIWFESGGREVIFLEGVTGIEFRDGKVVFQTVLGETISLTGEMERVTLRQGEGILQTNK